VLTCVGRRVCRSASEGESGLEAGRQRQIQVLRIVWHSLSCMGDACTKHLVCVLDSALLH
jgi:hypothetical protein